MSKETKSYQENLGEVGDGQTEVEMKSLLARKSGEARQQGKAAAECNTWKGRVVKNFKKFRKVLKVLDGFSFCWIFPQRTHKKTLVNLYGLLLPPHL